MAEWLRPRVSIAENELNIRRISVGSKSCPSKKTIDWAVGAKVTSRRYYGRRKPIKKEGSRMVEWLRPRALQRERTKYTPDMWRFESC